MRRGARGRFRIPEADIVSFDHLVGASEQCGRHGEAKRFGGFEVDDQFIFRWKCARPSTSADKNLIYLMTDLRHSVRFAAQNRGGEQQILLKSSGIGTSRWPFAWNGSRLYAEHPVWIGTECRDRILPGTGLETTT
jgi:hypothetical protein